MPALPSLQELTSVQPSILNGAEVRVGAKGCPDCGSDDNTGWKEDETEVGALDLPEEDFDYDEFTRREFGAGRVKPHGIAWKWWVTAIVLLILIIAAGGKMCGW